MSDVLEPCPFCGGKIKENENLFYLERRRYRVVCRKCKSATIFSNLPSWDAAIAAWNKRVETKHEENI